MKANHTSSIFQQLCLGILAVSIGFPSASFAQQYQLDTSGAAAFGGSLGQGLSYPLSPGGNVRMFWYPHKAAFRAGMNDLDVLYDPDTCTPIADESPGYFWEPWLIGEFSFAVGKNSLASGSSSFAAGDSNRVVFAPSGVAIGFDNYVEGMAGTAIGYSNDAWGAQSVALGFANTAEGSGSVALGDANEAIGDGSLAFGSGSKALSTASVAGGFQSEAKGGSGAVALGDNVLADGPGAFAAGTKTEATGHYSFAGGFETKATRTGSVALGYRSWAHGDRSAAFNSFTIASGNNSAAFGDGTWAVHRDSFAIGRFNDQLPNEPIATRPLFMVGYGSGDQQDEQDIFRRNALEVRANGDVIIKRVPPRGGISMGNFQ